MEREINYCDLFSGIGGFALGLLMAGFTFKNHFYSEVDAYGQKLYGLRFPGAVGLGDIRGIRGRELGAIDILTGGFPCQPFSVAGQQRGAEDDRYLWPEMFRVIKATKPTWIIAENVTGIIKLALDEVLSDLEGKGYACQTLIVPACALNAPHRRNRIWIVAYNNDTGKRTSRKQTEQKGRKDISGGDKEINTNANRKGLQGRKQLRQSTGELITPEKSWESNWPEVATELCGMDDGLSAELDGFKLSKSGHRVERLKSLGNAVVPQIVAEIGRSILETN